MSERVSKVNSLLHRAISDIILLEHNHPSFQLISVMKVDTAKDLSHAKIFVSAMKNEEELIKYLTKITPVIQKKLMKKVKLRITPKLRFELDVESDYLNKMNELIVKSGIE
ncbi:MAG: 30S ribosome-binding factor RbfA [Candidatus Peregrinibacteria bacterium]|nr:30S ribosome-binding factor RbfA [Candidatus Peregrinibacteria bacterium]MDZ4245084.1 30S ribosome-binding factor RbfA [Candidatus Gracilibacteria bacterium]